MSPWEVLGLAEGASPADVKKAWRRLAMESHPDQNPEDPEAEARFKRLQVAYEALTGGEGAPAAASSGDGPDDDWLDTLAWMAAHRTRVVLDELLPRYIAEHGPGHSMAWQVHRALERRDLEGGAPERPLGFWLRWRIRRRLRHVRVEVGESRWASGLVNLRKTHRGAQLQLEAHAFWRQAPRDEDDLRVVVFRAVELGLIGAVSLVLGLRRIPATLEAAQEADRERWSQQRLWRGIWGGVVLLVTVLVATAWLSRH